MENYTERNAAIVQAVTRLMSRGNSVTGRPLSVAEAVRRALEGGAPRFYVSREYAWKQLRLRRKGLKPKRGLNNSMWQEIEAALESRMAACPRESRWEALDFVLSCHKASGFFITQPYAMRLVNDYFRNHKRKKNNLEP